MSAICGGRADLVTERPKDIDTAYSILIPFKLKWREKFGGVECDCTEVIESYAPYYGFTLYHSDRCAIRAYLKKYPQRENFCFEWDPRVIAHSE